MTRTNALPPGCFERITVVAIVLSPKSPGMQCHDWVKTTLDLTHLTTVSTRPPRIARLLNVFESNRIRDKSRLDYVDSAEMNTKRASADLAPMIGNAVLFVTFLNAHLPFANRCGLSCTPHRSSEPRKGQQEPRNSAPSRKGAQNLSSSQTRVESTTVYVMTIQLAPIRRPHVLYNTKAPIPSPRRRLFHSVSAAWSQWTQGPVCPHSVSHSSARGSPSETSARIHSDHAGANMVANVDAAGQISQACIGEPLQFFGSGMGTHAHTIVIMIVPATKSPLVSRRRRPHGNEVSTTEGAWIQTQDIPPFPLRDMRFKMKMTCIQIQCFSHFHSPLAFGDREARRGDEREREEAGSDAPEGKVARRCGCAAVDAHGDRRNIAESTLEGGGWGLVKGRGETAAGSSPLCARTQSGRGWDGRAVRGGGRNALRQEEAGGGMRWGEQRRRARSTPRLHCLLITHRAINLNMLPSKSPCDSVGNCGHGIAHDTTSPSPPVFQPFP
ncbi:hypothetical protein K438DRAFT_2101362 [Mycena galopus ATCC 62051]|nr:hypothetical protein K438DRAFT_2101362 [Mycena galopus ATCC 62051]